jgi:Divergent InlB B-repeat domain/NHL repeat
MIRRLSLAALCASLLIAALPATPAPAAEPPNHPFRFEISHFEPEEHRTEFLEGPCGLALDSQGDIYVGDYYHDQVVVFGPSGGYLNRMVEEEPLDGPCGLGLDSAGDLYVNNYHRDVVRFALSNSPPLSFPANSLTTGPAQAIDSAHSTGLALDPATGDLYVDDRTYVAEYEAPVEPGEEPAEKIGLGSLGSGYGVAVSDYPATEGFLYVPDAASDTVKVYDPAVNLTEPIAEVDGAGTPQGGFDSLVDSTAAIDQSDGHLFVADNLQSLDFEHPRAALDEFNAAGDYRGSLPKFPTLIDGEPTGVAIDNSGTATQGDVYVTSGNTEKSSVYAFGPTFPAHTLEVTKTGEGEGTVTSEPAGIECGTACTAEYNADEEVVLTAVPDSGSAFAGWSGGGCSGIVPCHLTLGADGAVSASFEAAAEPLALIEAAGASGAAATALGPPAPAARISARPTAHSSEVKQQGNLRVSFEGELTPHALPRQGSAPVKVSVGARIATTDGQNPPQLRKIAIAINRNGRLSAKGLPLCKLRDIQPSTTADALAACRSSRVGHGSFSARVLLPQQAPFPSAGKVFAFNGTYRGRLAIFAHVYGTNPIPTSYTIPFAISQAKGTYGTLLTASLPQVTSEWGYVTGLQMTLGRTFFFHGKRRSYLSAACPAPKGFPGAVFPFARASFSFGRKGTLTSVLTRSCGVRG